MADLSLIDFGGRNWINGFSAGYSPLRAWPSPFSSSPAGRARAQNRSRTATGGKGKAGPNC